MGPTISIQKTSQMAQWKANVESLSRAAVYVGIPASGSSRRQAVRRLGLSTKSRKSDSLAGAIAGQINNAELLFIQSKGSPLRGIPARPVLEPAIEANTATLEPFAREVIRNTLLGNRPETLRSLNRLGMAGRNAARRWFFDSRNGWQKNAASTIAAKGSKRPLIDTGAMRAAITFVVDHPDVGLPGPSAETAE